MKESYERTLSLLQEKSYAVTAIAEELLTKETINAEDITRLIGKRPFPMQVPRKMRFILSLRKLSFVNDQ